MAQTLRLTQSSVVQGNYKIQISLSKDVSNLRTTEVSFSFNLTSQDQEDLRWYFEDFLQYPQDPAPEIAERIENRMRKIGSDLFDKVFKKDDDAHDIWSDIKNNLSETAIEVVTGVQEANTIPWELIRDPKADSPLVLDAGSFIRGYYQSLVKPNIPKIGDGPIRILLVICRPGGASDVPFRSVASRVIVGLSKHGPKFKLDILRPPTFMQLSDVLMDAKAKGKPYHILHFDGHGTYAQTPDQPYSHGYLAFENPSNPDNVQLVDGTAIGRLMVATNVPLVVLNACRSAYAESPNQPASIQEEMDQHKRIRAFGSLAQEIIDQGVAGVVAMRYMVYVVTAAQFVADLYGSLTLGQTLGEAVSRGRKQLHDQPVRSLAFKPRQLQDWSVPLVFGAAPLAFFRPTDEKKLDIKILDAAAIPSRGTLDQDLPPSPDTGFFGRDETLQAIDRAFDTQRVVLLHSYAGNGKSATAVEFARWYSLTGGVDGPVLFTSFERYKTLPRVLDKIGQIFGGFLEANNINWLALNDVQRYRVALELLKQVPVLWIWDNVEGIAGFPRGIKSAWSDDEQRALSDFLRDAGTTQAKFLLTSRREEIEWLSDLPSRLTIPPMPMLERVELARAVADKTRKSFFLVEDWTPLLKFSQGNPLTINLLVSQALRDGLKSKADIEAFVNRLQAGEDAFLDEVSHGRSKSLGASLNYGFENAFDDSELRLLALLHFFQGFVDADALRYMSSRKQEWSLALVDELSRDGAIELLDKASEIGQLTKLGGGYYRIHPALPWFFNKLFHERYEGEEDMAVRAFVEAIGDLGDHYHDQFEDGNTGVVTALAFEEANLLQARKMALEHGWWHRAIGTMQGLRQLYDHYGRSVEWTRLVQEIVPFFVDLKSDQPLPGRENGWVLVSDYIVRLARKEMDLEEALRRQEIKIAWVKKQADQVLSPLRTRWMIIARIRSDR